MNDERLDREIRALLREDEPSHVPYELSERIDRIADEHRAPRLAGGLERVPRSGWMAVVAAALVLAVGIGLALGRPWQSETISHPSAGPSTLPSIGPSVPASPAPSASSMTSLGWSKVSWSPLLRMPSTGDTWTGTSPLSFSSVVLFHGAIYASGTVAAPTSAWLPAALWKSTDGTHWTQVTPKDSAFAQAHDVRLVATSTRLVAYGPVGPYRCATTASADPCNITDSMVWTSGDGETWTPIPDASPLVGRFLGRVAAGPTGLVGLCYWGGDGRDTTILWSADGTRWEPVAKDASVFAGAHVIFVAASADTYVLTGGTGTIEDQTPGGGMSLRPKEAAAWWSTDGRTWTKSAIDPSGEAGSEIGEVAVGSKGMAASGTPAGKLGDGVWLLGWTSADGRTWKSTAITDGSLASRAAKPGGIPSANFLVGIGDRIISAAEAEDGGVRLYASPDGVTWVPLANVGETKTAAFWVTHRTSDQMIDNLYVLPDRILIQTHLFDDTLAYWWLTPEP